LAVWVNAKEDRVADIALPTHCVHVTVSVIGSMNGQGKILLDLIHIWIMVIWKWKPLTFALLRIVYHCTGHSLATGAIYS